LHPKITVTSTIKERVPVIRPSRVQRT
jgi:hypothetical protein